MKPAPITHMTVWLYEERMIEWARSLGFDGYDARDAAFFIRGHIGIQVHYHNDHWCWFMQVTERHEWFILQHGEYFI